MAHQTANPRPWVTSMADGCSGVLDLGYTVPCEKHDRAYHYGGSIEDKLVADGKFYDDMCEVPGFWGWMARRGIARTRYIGVRWTTYNYPPGHPSRKTDVRIEAFNWLGPGPR
tara:strand:+ start:2249 stop:2587 length:339 start_codon:yes stop_codon:yes gene_type:complete